MYVFKQILFDTIKSKTKIQFRVNSQFVITFEQNKKGKYLMKTKRGIFRHLLTIIFCILICYKCLIRTSNFRSWSRLSILPDKLPPRNRIRRICFWLL